MTHRIRIVSSNQPPLGGMLGDLGSQLQGLIGQAQSLVSSAGGVGLPGLNSIGGQITSVASSISGAGGAGSSIAGTIAGLGAQMASATNIGAISGLMSGLTSQLSSLMDAMNPAGMMSQETHFHLLDKMQGIATSAFQGQHTTTWNQGGITHSSTSKVTSTAPMLPHNGNILGSDNFILSKVMTAGNFNLFSDRRLKSNIRPFYGALDRLMRFRFKFFHKKFVRTDDDGVASIHEDGEDTFGVIAQEAREVMPEIVRGDEATGYLSVDEAKIGIMTAAAFQEFVLETRAEIAELKRQLAAKG